MSNCRHGVNNKHCRACKKQRVEKERGGMSDYQINNMRKFLSSSIGPYAWLMPIKDVVAYKNRIQREIDLLGKGMAQ